MMPVAQRVSRWRSSAGEGPSAVAPAQTESTHCPDDESACPPMVFMIRI